MRIKREAKGSAYLWRSQLLPRKSLQNINYHRFHPSETAAMRFLCPKWNPNAVFGGCFCNQFPGFWNQCVWLAKAKILGCSSGLHVQLCSQSILRHQHHQNQPEQGPPILLKSSREFLVSDLLPGVFNSGCRRRISCLMQQEFTAHCLYLNINNDFRPFCI